MNSIAGDRVGLAGDEALLPIRRDLPAGAFCEQPRNIALHVASLSLTRVGEGLADAKLVLAWLLDAIGAPACALTAVAVTLRSST